jgi:hypothetical protein
MPPSVPGDYTLIETEMDTQQQQESTNHQDGTATTIVLMTVTCIGGYGMGVNDTEVRLTCFMAASVLFVVALIMNWDYVRQTEFFQWMAQQRSSFSSISLGRMASKSSSNALSSLSRVTSVDAFKHLSSNLLSSLDCSNQIRSAIQSITRKECFARLDFIERLSINDISILFRYAADANLDTFEEEKFLADNTPTVRAVITAIKMAVRVSRGSLSEGTKISSTEERTEGDIDALRFVAVTRIFAEWRNLRMVPKGYHKCAISMSVGYRDALQNLEKIERGVHAYLRHHQKLNAKSAQTADAPIPSPSLRQLLQFEAETNLHERLPRLTEKSSASGLLWVKRQLQYNTLFFSNALELPSFYPSAEEAVRAAYHGVYVEYHGWAVKQLFTRTFSGSPPMEKFWKNLSPPTDVPRNNRGKFNRTNDDFEPRARTDSLTNSASMSTDRDDHEEHDNEVLVALDKMRLDIVEKWEDLLRMFNCGLEEKKKDKENLILSSQSHFNLNQFHRDVADSSLPKNSGEDVSDTVSLSSNSSSMVADTNATKEQELIEKSRRDTEDFVRSFSPVVADLGAMFDQLNMHDPTKV